MPGKGTLTIDASADADAVIVRLRDTGVGMDEEALDRVFEPYFSTKTTGTGLGLPIARRNIELSRGSIEVDSQKGAGTTVTVRLPVVLGRNGISPRSPVAPSPHLNRGSEFRRSPD